MKAALLKMTQGSSGPLRNGLQNVLKTAAAGSESLAIKVTAGLRRDNTLTSANNDVINRIEVTTNAVRQRVDAGVCGLAGEISASGLMLPRCGAPASVARG